MEKPTYKELFDAMHEANPALAHEFLGFLINYYGRESAVVREIYGKENH